MICRVKEGFKLSDILRDFKRHTAKKLLQSIKDNSESRSDWLLEILKKLDQAILKTKNIRYGDKIIILLSFFQMR